MLFFLIMVGSAIFVSAFVVHVRKCAFETKFKSVVEQKGQRFHSPRNIAMPTASASQNAISDPMDINGGVGMHMSRLTYDIDGGSATDDRTKIGLKYAVCPTDVAESALNDQTRDAEGLSDRIKFNPNTHFSSPSSHSPHRRRGSSVFAAQGVGARPSAGLYLTASQIRASTHGIRDSERPSSAKDVTGKYSLSSGYTTRNSQFHGLSEADREKLGGVEYKAICFLAWVVPAYYVLFQLFGCFGLAAYVAYNRPDTAQSNGLNPWWVGAFNGVSAFNNSGMSLLDANMTAFQTSYYMLLTMGLMILAGNTCFPIFLRLIIATMLKLMPKSESWDERRQTLRFLLEHPRRCYTNLFPSEHTWWLAFAVIVLNGTDWAAFEILNVSINHFSISLVFM